MQGPWRNVEGLKGQGIYSNATVRLADGSMLWKRRYILGSWWNSALFLSFFLFFFLSFVCVYARECPFNITLVDKSVNSEGKNCSVLGLFCLLPRSYLTTPCSRHTNFRCTLTSFAKRCLRINVKFYNLVLFTCILTYMYMKEELFLSAMYCSDASLLLNKCSRVVWGLCVARRHPVGRACLCGSVVVLILISFLCNSMSSVRLKISLSNKTWNRWLTEKQFEGRQAEWMM